MSMRALLASIQGLPSALSTQLFRLISSRAPHRKKDLKLCMFPSGAYCVMLSLGMEEIRRVMQVLLASHLHANKDVRIAELPLTLSFDKSVPVTNVSVGRKVHLILEKQGHSTESELKQKYAPTSCEALVVLNSLSSP